MTKRLRSLSTTCHFQLEAGFLAEQIEISKRSHTVKQYEHKKTVQQSSYLL